MWFQIVGFVLEWFGRGYLFYSYMILFVYSFCLYWRGIGELVLVIKDIDQFCECCREELLIFERNEVGERIVRFSIFILGFSCGLFLIMGLYKLSM